MISFMDWIIDNVRPDEEAVYLKKPLVGIARKISVPGAVNACIEQGRLLIWANTGHLWEVDPHSGHRKRRAVPTACNASVGC
jgi:hypothetical protein